jgi:hypothetical protein
MSSIAEGLMRAAQMVHLMNNPYYRKFMNMLTKLIPDLKISVIWSIECGLICV